MPIGLRSGITFCQVSDRLVFLDVAADRYFVLEPKAEAGFRRLMDGTCNGAPELAPLLRRGILVDSADICPPRQCEPPPPPRMSVLDAHLPDVPVRTVLAAASGLIRIRLQLCIGGLGSMLRSFAESKARSGDWTPSVGVVERVAAAFEYSARLTRSHDQCLARSVAVATKLAASGVAADLVIGVHVRPFGAHCWIQVADRLVNDRYDAVRAYTPILVL